MASVSSLYSPSHRLCHCYFTSLSTNRSPHVFTPNRNRRLLLPSISSRIRGHPRQRVLCCNKYCHEEQPELLRSGELYGTGNGTKRREALLKIAFTASNFPAIIASNALAEIENFRVYTDDANKFQISIPNDWLVGAGEPNGFKSVTAFYPEEASGSNVSVVITGLGPDFTRLESLGKVDAFAETLVGGLDRSWQRPPGVAAKLIDCKAANGFYYIEYTLQNPGETRRHLFSALGMAFNGWYNRLYTVTGQFVDEESEKYGSEIKKAVSSFRFI